MYSIKTYKSKGHGQIDVYYYDDLDGGGGRFGQDFIRLVGEKFGPVGRVFEWCSGPGFIGFSLLAHGLCDSLCLADVNRSAVDACLETVARNRLVGKVDVYLSDCLEDIPSSEKWDLVVGNPPHSGTDEKLFPRPDLIYMDIDWGIHNRFYAQIREFLKEGARVAIQENRQLSSLQDFQTMINRGGLQVLGEEECLLDERFYYIISRST